MPPNEASGDVDVTYYIGGDQYEPAAEPHFVEGSLILSEYIPSAGDLLGHLADFSIDVSTGNIVSLLVVTEVGIDPNELPWSTTDGLLAVPVEEVSSIGSVVELSR